MIALAAKVAPAPRDSDPAPSAPDNMNGDAARFSTAIESLVLVGIRHGVHLSASDLVRDNRIGDQEPSAEALAACARRADMRASATRLDWRSLTNAIRALPAIVRLKSGAYMVLLSI